ncbi:hypothetical protein [Abditibacterium utsteinense]|uniref:hypothetical protein n=1 Tax=Abditibacterium utsteinense TaxID=1960156 RepID=UPI00130016F1|nr:hypothetical protein [Abditibacterium utsteinense]
MKEERTQAREFKARIDVFLDDVKREIIKAAKAPNRNEQQKGRAKRKVFAEQNARRDDSRQQKQKAFEDDEARRFEVAHEFLWIVASSSRFYKPLKLSPSTKNEERTSFFVD